MSADAAPPRREGGSRKPGWMSISGGPKEPSHDEFLSKLKSLSKDKSACFDKLKEIRNKFDAGKDDPLREEMDRERRSLKDRLSQIDGSRKDARADRREKDDEIRRVRQQRWDIENKLKVLYEEVGAFKDLSDVDEAIDRVIYKMETSGASLKQEKECVKRLNQLEEAKRLILQLQPLTEAIHSTEDREAELQREYRDIHERIKELNKDYDKNATEKKDLDARPKQSNIDVAALKKEREQIREKLQKINDAMDEARKKHDDQKAAWDEWKKVAQAKWKEQEAAKYKEREERRKAYLEKKKMQKHAAKIAQRRNPYEREIDECDALIKYLHDKVEAQQRDKERAERQKKLAAFDATATAPKGTTVRGPNDDDDWIFGDRTKEKQKQKNQKAQQLQKRVQSAEAAESKKKGSGAGGNDSQRPLHHSADKSGLFNHVGVEIPLSFGQIAATIETLKKKKVEYESHKKDIDVADVSSSDDEEQEETAAAAENDNDNKKEETA